MNKGMNKINMLTEEPWELLQKKMIWHQLAKIDFNYVLDFGSGKGNTANYLAKNHDVIAIEPSEQILCNRTCENQYTQLTGSLDQLKTIDDLSMDLILCHNVFEYMTDISSVMKEFLRILKKGGVLSIVKHNRLGRVMQQAVLLNEFQKAHHLLDGHPGEAKLMDKSITMI